MQNQLAYLIAIVNRQLEDELQDKLRPEGIPIEQFRILSALKDGNGLAMGDLAARVLVDSTTLTKIIDRMVTAMLVYRAPDPNDRRKVLVFLTAKGGALIGRLEGVVGEQEEKLVNRLQQGKAEELTRILQTLVRN
ncbi:MarR family transcriptional regulator [Stappia sp. GBMRC 2046]|uniref:MarR family transcriptional regulator n=1 Tax=Stappia sediminis TaxID=2692190 RepID=A0A7X3LYN8_9HYPH|nr:MarR family transcriptional regulator [Stappia sediminis]MXN67496.1 MarR family transcriptional regulator [Stappia sediminis]